MTRNIRLVIEYEGTEYAGWQVQRSEPTVQGELIRALKRLTGVEEVELSGASRTDAGVHAMGQVANFHTNSTIPPAGIQRGLNSMLPRDIVVREAAEVPEGFDSRRDSTGKVYLYRVLNRDCPSALLRRFSWHVPRPLDLGLMREGAAHLVGEKDFSSFRAADSNAAHSVREVTSISIERKGAGEEDMVEIEVRGTAFLRHMVRIMAGTLVTVGLGKLGPEHVEEIVEARERKAAPMTAPPQGLFLARVEYR